MAAKRAIELGNPLAVCNRPASFFAVPTLALYPVPSAEGWLHLVSSIATNRTREALYNSWDKNDPYAPLKAHPTFYIGATLRRMSSAAWTWIAPAGAGHQFANARSPRRGTDILTRSPGRGASRL